MKLKLPSNVFTLPNWMKNLRVKEPEGTRTPDQVASSLELCLLFNDGNLDVLRDAIIALVPKVPLKRQPFMRALIEGDMLANVQAFIDEVNQQLAQFTQEAVSDVQQQPPQVSGGSLPVDWDSDTDGLRVRSKPSTRGQRALRNAKRQSAES